MNNAESEQPRKFVLARAGFPLHGWFGLSLVLLFWAINWSWDGLRTQWAFFPMWLGYCLTVDGLVYWRAGTSLLMRGRWKYVGLFVISAPAWWAFEALNLRTQNWQYLGVERFSNLEYAFWTTLSFSIVIPAVFGSAEFLASFDFLNRLGSGLVLRPDRRTTIAFFLGGWCMLALLLIWPRVFFPFIWLSLYFIVEPVNVWLGHRSLTDWTQKGDWRPVIALWLGVLMTAFFWEMWNYLSYPKWIYHVPGGGGPHVFEMPLLGYGGYLPFALELFAFYHLIMGVFGRGRTGYIQVDPDRTFPWEQD